MYLRYVMYIMQYNKVYIQFVVKLVGNTRLKLVTSFEGAIFTPNPHPNPSPKQGEGAVALSFASWSVIGVS